MEGEGIEIAPAALRDVEVRYPGREEPAIEGVSLELRRGKIVALTGPNGGGKTTILRVLSGLIPNIIRADVKGEVLVDGLDPRRENVAHLLQHMQQDPKAQIVGPTVLLEAAAGPLLSGMPRREVAERALRALKAVGAEALAKRSTASLSGGELERVAIAGVLSMEPRYLLLDEPMSYLDCEARRVVAGLLSELRRSGVGVMLATHSPGLAGMADEHYIVNRTVEPGVFEPPEPPGPVRRVTRHRGRPLLEARNISFSYPGRPPILRGASICLEEGSLTALWGPNGSGKTTLLLVLAGLLHPSRGRVEARERVSLLPQDPLLVFSRATLREELSEGRDLPGWASGLEDEPLLSLSWGRLRLAALALTVARGGRVLLLDEPTSGLDPWNRLRVIRALEDLASAGYAVLAATHDPWLARAADRVLCIEGGVLRPCSGAC